MADAGEKVETSLARIAVHGGRFIKLSFPTDLNPDWGAAIQWDKGDDGMKYFVARTPELLLTQVLDFVRVPGYHAIKLAAR